MSSWSEGYVSNVNYTFGYYPELNPNNIAVSLLMAGLAVPESMSNACELGFGQGISLNIHASAGGINWYATDFNPSQANFAQHLSRLSGNGAFIADQGFSEFCRRDDLPEFDFIGLHGIWSWISDENRHIIVDFLRRKLKIGGVLYISYNTLPGWSATTPMRHLLTEHYHGMSSLSREFKQSVSESIDFLSKVFEQSPVLTQKAPELRDRVNNLKNADPHYIAHEYLNKDWEPMYFADMRKWLEPAKLTYAASAQYLDDFADCQFTPEQNELFNSFQDPNFAQTVKDFMLNKQFRKDLWVKGGRKLNNYEKSEAWKSLRVVLRTPRQDIELRAIGARDVELNTQLFEPVLDVLQDHKIHNVRNLVGKLPQLQENHLFAVLAILCSKGDLALAQNDEIIEQARPRCEAFNRYVLSQSHSTEFNINHLASPVSGGAYCLPMVQRWFLLAYNEGIKFEKWADFALDLLKRNNLTLNSEGKVLTDEAENKAFMQRLAEEFKDRYLVELTALGII